MNARWPASLPLLITLCVAVFLRVSLINQQGLWADELFSLAIATGHSLEHPASKANPELGDYVETPSPVPAILYQNYLTHKQPPAGPVNVTRSVALSDTSPPLYYLLLNAWTRVAGTSDGALRSFSVLFAVACLPLLWLTGREVGGKDVALTACILFAVAPVSLFYSTEGRMYSMLWFFSLSTVWLTLILQRRGFQSSFVAVLVLSSAAGLLTHYFFAFVLLSCFVWLFISPGALARQWIGVGAGLTALFVAPWYIQIPGSLARWRVTGYWLNGFPEWREALKSPVRLAWNFLSGNGYWGYSAWGTYLGYVLFGLVAILLCVSLFSRSDTRQTRLVFLWLFAACTGPMVFDLLLSTHTSLIPRYALAGMPSAFLLIGVGLQNTSRGIRMVMVGLILLAWYPNISNILQSRSRADEPFQEVGELISTSKRQGDLVIVHSIPSGVLGISRYIPTDTEIASWVGQLGRRRVPEDIEGLIAGYRRVILVKIHDVSEPAPEEFWLRENARLVQEVHRESAQLSYFVPRKSNEFSTFQIPQSQ